MPQVHISVQHDDFDLAAEYEQLRRDAGHAGAIVTFCGLVRDQAGDPLQAMELEHYPGMTEKSLAQIARQAGERWPLQQVRLIHRVGILGPAEQIVFVGVAGPHRAEAFAACQFIMDYLKRDAPFWKKECTRRGERWVVQKDSDRAAADTWDA